MKSVFWFVFLMFTLVLSQKDCVYAHKRGGASSKPKPQTPELVTVSSTEEALKELTQAGKPIVERWGKFFLSPFCRTLDMVSKFRLTNYGRRCDFERTCYVVGFPSGGVVSVHVISKDTSNEDTPPGSEQFANTPKFQAVLLPFIENENTYMILDPARAPWFFTDKLGGCDIFVATAKNQGNRPLVLHANRNLHDDQRENLQAKGDFVNNMMKNINGNYRVIARAYFKPRDPPKLVQRVEDYIRQYKQNHQGVILLPYNNLANTPQEQYFYFFGQHVTEQHPARWRFYLKGMKDGSLYQFDVSQSGSLMN